MLKYNDDILYNIMLQADLNTLRELCSTNKTATKISTDVLFWYTKYQNEGLSTYDYITKIKLQPIDKYQLILKAKKQSEDILIMNKIEKYRTDYNTNGIIMLYINYEYTSLSQLGLSSGLIEKIQKQLKHPDIDIEIRTIHITLKNKNTYDIELSIRDTVYYDTIYITITVDDISTKMLLYKFILDYQSGYSNMQISDTKMIDFIFDHKFDLINYPYYTGERLMLLCMRRGIWQGLNTSIK